MSTQIVEQKSAILHVSQEITIPQHSDHRNIVRFKSPQDRTFRPVLCRLKDLLCELDDESTRRAESSPTTGTIINKDPTAAILFLF